MKLEGIHHVTAITGDAPGNVDFYARVLGLRLVKKTVNQDDPTVYHLFYADEQGSAGADITFFEYPGARRGPAGAGMVHRVVFRVGSRRRARLLGRAARARGRRDATRERELASSSPTPRGSTSSCASSTRATSRSSRTHPEIPREHALQGFDGVRAYALEPERSRALRSRRRSASSRRGDGGWEARGDAARRLLRATTAAERARRRAARAPSTTSRGPRRWTSTRPGSERVAEAGAHPTPGDRPLLLPLDLLPRAERRAVRDRHARPRLRHRRGPRSTSASGSSLPPDFEHLRDAASSRR